jgi:hypothetical protein
LARLREDGGDLDGAERALLRAANAGNTNALGAIARLRQRAGDLDGAEHIRRFGLMADGRPEKPWT